MMSLFADGTMSEPASPGWTLAGWAVSILVALIGSPIIVSYLSKKRGKHVLVTRTSTGSLVQIAEHIRSHIKVTLKDVPVRQLSFVNLTIENTDPENALEDIQLSLHFPAAIILEHSINPSVPTVLSDDKQKLQLTIPMLNSAKLHKEKIAVSIICDGPVDGADDGLRIGGRGKNWTVRFVFHPPITIPMWLGLSGFLLTTTGFLSMFIMIGFSVPPKYGTISMCAIIIGLVLLAITSGLNAQNEKK